MSTFQDAISRAGWLHNPEYWRHHTTEHQEGTNHEHNHNLSLTDFTLGPVIGQGCNAAVYAARWQAGAYIVVVASC